MITHQVDVAVIGAGPAGLAAATSAYENGAKNIMILDRNSWTGGILPQCIHDGFGLEETGHSMTGPEYAEMYIKKAEKHGIKIIRETMVLEFNKKREITIVNKKGLQIIKAKSIILATGCREKTRWNIMIPGERPSGIYTAGVAQAFINLYNIIPGKNIVILGSGDVGLIMARRLKFEGANVIGVVEILPYASGLPRNVVQCLDDYDIPLYLNHTVTCIEGRQRLKSVTIAQVDQKKNIIKSTEKKIQCDTLLLSLGLIPENELATDIGIDIDNLTGGPVINQNFETKQPGFYACGNCLQVYDTVDALAMDAKKAGKHAAKKAKIESKNKVEIKPGNGVRYVIPQYITEPGKIRFTLRTEHPKESSTLKIVTKNKEIFKKKIPWVNPANMIIADFNLSDEIFKTTKSLEVKLDD